MKTLRPFFLAASLALILGLTACAAPPALQDRDEWIAATNRGYKDVSKEDVLRAADYLFRLADGKDFTIVHEEDGLQATRQWMQYLVIFAGFGSDRWVVRARETPEGWIHTSVSVSLQSQAAGPSQPTLSGGTPLMGPTFGTAITNPWVYRLFWARMDYLLGKRSDWLTCDDASRLFDVSRATNGMEVLCNPLNMADNKPNGPLLKK